MIYKLLLFDADNTLYDFDYAEREALKSAIAELNLQNSFEENFEIYKKINLQIWKEFEEKKITSENLKSERFKRFFSQIDVKADPEIISIKYLFYLSRINKLLPDAYEVIEELSKRFKIAVITNGLVEVQKPRFEFSKIRNLIHAIIISGEVGFSKPDPEIFQIACDRFGISDKSEVLMIGDNFDTDIIGGINFGIDTCWLNSSHKKNENSYMPKYEIHSISELKEILLF